MLPPVPVMRQTFPASLPAITVPGLRRRDSSGRSSGAVAPGEGDASYRLTRPHSRLGGFPNARSPACVNGARSDRDLESALTDAQLASGKSLVAMCSSGVPRLVAVSVHSSRLHQRPDNRPNSWRRPCLRGGAVPVLEGLGVIGGEISSPKQVMRWLAPTPRSERLRRVRRATRILSQTAGGGEPP